MKNIQLYLETEVLDRFEARKERKKVKENAINIANSRQGTRRSQNGLCFKSPNKALEEWPIRTLTAFSIGARLPAPIWQLNHQSQGSDTLFWTYLSGLTEYQTYMSSAHTHTHKMIKRNI